MDSVKVFDVLLVNAYYLTRPLKAGGMLVFDVPGRVIHKEHGIWRQGAIVRFEFKV